MEVVVIILIMTFGLYAGVRQQLKREARRGREDRARLRTYEQGDLPRTRYEARQIHRAQRGR